MIQCRFSLQNSTPTMSRWGSTVNSREYGGQDQCNGALHRSRNDTKVKSACAVLLPCTHGEHDKGKGTQCVVRVGQLKSIDGPHHVEHQHKVDAITTYKEFDNKYALPWSKSWPSGELVPVRRACFPSSASIVVYIQIHTA